MQFSKSLVLAVLAMAYATPMISRSEISPEVSKNCAAIDQAVLQMVMNLTHLTVQTVSKFVSNITKSIESAVSSIENMVVNSESKGLVKASLGPFVTSVARGSIFLVEGLAKSPDHLITPDTVNQLVQSLEKVSTIASAHDVPTNELTSAIAKLNGVNSHLQTRSEISPEVSKNCAAIDQAVLQMVMNLTHLTVQTVSKFVSSITKSIESAVSNIENMVVSNKSNGLVKAALGPLVTSVARGSTFLVEALAKSPDHLITPDVVSQLVQSLEKVSTVASVHNVPTGELTSAISQLNGVSTHLQARSEISPEVSKNCAAIDEAVLQIVMNLTHLTVEAVSKFVSNITKSIESAVSNIENMIVSNKSNGLVKAALGPLVTSVARGSTFLVEALAKSPDHLITPDTVNQLVQSLEKVSTVASAQNVSTGELTSAISQLNGVSTHLQTRSEISPEVSKNCAAIDQAVLQIVMNLTHLTVEAVSKFVSSITKSIESAVSNIENMVVSNKSNGLVKAALGPLVTSVARGSTFLVEALAKSPNHLITPDTVNQLVQSLEKVSTVASAHNVPTIELTSAIAQLNGVSTHLETRADFNPIFDAIKGSATNAQQTIETLIKQLKSNDGHPTADVFSAAITGLDSQIDNLVNMVAVGLGPLTFGVSNLVGDALLGPVFQSITNGAEVLIANLAGGAVDVVTQPAIQLFAYTLNRVVALGNQNHIKATSDLQNAVARLNAITKASATTSAVPSHKA